MPHYRRVGEVPPKRHTQARRPDGGLYYEELMGDEGFSSDSTLLYHRSIPSAIVSSSGWDLPDRRLVPHHPLKPRHLVLPHLFAEPGADLVTGRKLVLGNVDVRLWYGVAERTSPLYRNAAGDECVYIESGSGLVETVLGPIPFGQGDYVVLPMGLTHRWVLSGLVKAYVIEASSHLAPPRRYLSQRGQLLEHAPYCERDLHGPAVPLVAEGRDVEVLVAHRSGSDVLGTRLLYDQHPFDVVGWDGCLYPYTFNIADFEPITGRVHQPPPVHQVFEGHNFVVCNFVPRKVDYHPLAIPVPYYHSNVDSDEIMFYCGGNYEARKGSGIGQGSVSLHPGGIAHGPQPGAYEKSLGVEFFDELAVMVDTFRPMQIGLAGASVDDEVYAFTWAASAKAAPASGTNRPPRPAS